MKGGKINMIDLDFEYKMWKNRLNLFIKEIEILKERNEEVKNEEFIAELNTVELMVLDEHIDQLTKHVNRIKVQENELQFYNKDFPITSNHQYYKEHTGLREKMNDVSKIHFNRVADLIVALGI
ncbi:hypothetical protein [Carboxylicivirga sp. M1479]|uniref:hypothetical protein n=1 Tax=Carboxylicivirga sp. M1479 TaxID=2594476 RepID=UPI0011788B72|nr:hypothetical protein [Carboxylicivirga sp. M1479]TRX64263.1 hypothetical protein FNN09_18050 [Carboxylicivirga sp. M1479]